MLHVVNQKDFMNPMAETRYRFVSHVDPMAYPEVCDFYELLLVVSGEMTLHVSESDIVLGQGSMFLIRPGDVHSKKGEQVSYMCLAFSSHIFEDLMTYLKLENQYKRLKSMDFVPSVQLTNREFLSMKERFLEIDSLEKTSERAAGTNMRIILFEIYVKYWKQRSEKEAEIYEDLPEWLVEALKNWNTTENRQKGLDFFCEYTGFSKEHLCRSFKKYLGVSPVNYLNNQRLKYAIGLMSNPEYAMIDIAFESGFKSSSRFYHVFREVYGVSPKQFFLGKKADGKGLENIKM